MAFAATVAARLYEEVVGWRTSAQKIGLVCFFWGGGILSLVGLAFGLPAGTPFAKASLMFDPMDGWWLLNFGRNLVSPTEAYYHGIFLLAILMLLRKRFGAALALSALLSASHPFSGLSLALVFTTYAAIEIVCFSGAATIPFFGRSGGDPGRTRRVLPGLPEPVRGPPTAARAVGIGLAVPALDRVPALYLVAVFAVDAAHPLEKSQAHVTRSAQASVSDACSP